MSAQAEKKIPLLVGSCGQSGGDAGLEWTRDIAIEVARELGINPRIAVLQSDGVGEAIDRYLAFFLSLLDAENGAAEETPKQQQRKPQKAKGETRGKTVPD